MTWLAAQTQADPAAPPEVWGGGAVIIFLVLLFITLAFGKGRPHG